MALQPVRIHSNIYGDRNKDRFSIQMQEKARDGINKRVCSLNIGDAAFTMAKASRVDRDTLFPDFSKDGQEIIKIVQGPGTCRNVVYFGDSDRFEKGREYFEAFIGSSIGAIQVSPCSECLARSDPDRPKLAPIFDQCVTVSKNDGTLLYSGKCMSCVHQHAPCSLAPKPSTPAKIRAAAEATTPSTGVSKLNLGGGQRSIGGFSVKFEGNEFRLPAITQSDPKKIAKLLRELATKVEGITPQPAVRSPPSIVTVSSGTSVQTPTRPPRQADGPVFGEPTRAGRRNVSGGSSFGGFSSGGSR